ncbi:helix-turn-helix transcriptional regulator [Bacteroides hominis]|uniref:helix-turn-helix transcriptional regulator n=1 Tax=Bacteroides hominis TaxID=2763023 RepID=UPI00164A8586|nr:helix-turn-helix transcriptional regulator [Bacteroides hominis (ex Liu et al. 2022)]MBC5614546.1 helix-turn-helix transcriptional regulator [Bacteroides hominis (ex Liu et al. 2022)]
MINTSFFESMAFTAPVVCALICMVMMLMNAGAHKHNAQEKGLRIFLAATYLVTSLGWLGMVFYVVSPRIFAYYYTVFLLTLMLDQVMIYRFVSIITNTGVQRKFNRLHWVIPLVFTAISVISDLTVPVEQQRDVIFLEGTSGSPNTWFKAMYALTTLIFIVYNTLYPILNLRNIRRYRRFIVNYSSDAYSASLGWLAVIQVFILITVPLPLAGLLSGVSSFGFSYIAWLGALPYFVNYLLLCYNLLNDNYLIIQPDDAKEEVPVKTTTIDLKHFERYLREKKPYLNPNLRITDLARKLNTNRSYISTFINKEYNMNFCRLINRYRLQELERLRFLPSNSDKTNIELVLMAGFSNYRSYLRVKQEEDKLALLKVFER